MKSGNDQEKAFEPEDLQPRSQELFNSSQLSRANPQRVTLPPRGTASSIWFPPARVPSRPLPHSPRIRLALSKHPPSRALADCARL